MYSYDGLRNAAAGLQPACAAVKYANYLIIIKCIKGGYKMNEKQLERMKSGNGFVAALDQSGGSTPKALRLYGITEDQYADEEEMFKLVHEMRTRIITCPAFTSEHILAAILFKITMNSKIDGKYTADYLWENKGIVPILKVDAGLDEEKNGVRLMKPNPGLTDLLKQAKERNIFGTKMRSFISEPDEEGIRQIVKQQFDTARIIIAEGLVPIIEPEVSIEASEKAKCEQILHDEILKELDTMGDKDYLMFKLTLPEQVDLYRDFLDTPCTVRLLALSGGYSQEDANKKLAMNHGMVASFSRALTEKLFVSQSDAEFEEEMRRSICGIYEASLS